MLGNIQKVKKVRKRRKCLITTDNVGKIQKCLEKIRKRRKISDNVRNTTVRVKKRQKMLENIKKCRKCQMMIETSNNSR